MKTKISLLLVISPVLLLAGDHGGHTDIVPRTVNFLIFVGLAYYLLADKVKSIFTARSTKIADEFESVQNKLKDSNALREAAIAKIEESKKIAEDIIIQARKESEIIAAKILENSKREIVNLERHNEEFLQTETRKAIKNAVRTVLEEKLKENSIGLNKDELVSFVKEKVA
jgi:F-type H+-transporting ATPase subunit b